MGLRLALLHTNNSELHPMKKIALLLIITVTLLANGVTAQEIYSNSNFLKATNHSFASCYTLDAIVKGENQQAERDKALPLLKNNLSISKRCYNAIKAKYPTDNQLKKLQSWNEVLQKVVNGLDSENWQTEPLWQLGYFLVKLDLHDMVNLKLK